MMKSSVTLDWTTMTHAVIPSATLERVLYAGVYISVCTFVYACTCVCVCVCVCAHVLYVRDKC